MKLFFRNYIKAGSIIFFLVTLKTNVPAQSNDTLLLDKYCNLAIDYGNTNRDSSYIFTKMALNKAAKLDQKFYKAAILCDYGFNLYMAGDLSNALSNLLEAKKISEEKNIGEKVIKTTYLEYYFNPGKPDLNRIKLQIYIKNGLALVYGATGNFQKQLSELKENLAIVPPGQETGLKYTIMNNIANAFMKMKSLDSALYYQLKTLDLEKNLEDGVSSGLSNYNIGEIYFIKKNYPVAKNNYLKALKMQREHDNLVNLSNTQFSLGRLYRITGQLDSSLYFIKESQKSYQKIGDRELEMEDIYEYLALIFSDRQKYDSAYHYLRLAKDVRDSTSAKEVETLTNFHNLSFNEQMRIAEAEAYKIKVKNRNQILLLISGLGVICIIAFILYRNNRIKKKANDLLASQKKQIENTLDELKATQSQLIQSEKMASLGELTAGIAHEIQNPLNFVNNFSEVSNELIEEMIEELDKGEVQEAKFIANDVRQNLQKINHHGKRADSIVKGMLQHSRSSNGLKELTDINALCDEYLRLSYHGLRAKNKSFNATLKTDFDASIGKIDIIPQDLGRVILNLLTNAFYAVNEKKNSGLENYNPTVSISTKKIGNHVEIYVQDNGNGIPQSAIDKIFQPFFTTKPTGQGTGLGLSLAYDIVTKGHGGELHVETKESEGTSFTIKI